MRPLRDSIRDEQGFSLIELTIAMVIGLLVLGIAYMVFETSYTTYRIVEEDAVAASDGAYALQIISRYLREVEYIDYAGDNDLRVRCDHDDDGLFEEVRYYKSGTDLWEDVRELNSATLKSHKRLARYVRNTGPMFAYWKSVGAPCGADPNGERRTKTRLLTVTILLDVNPAKVPAPFEAKTEVTLRNQI